MNTATNQTAIAPVKEIRAQFPALERREGGYPVAYFDGPGGTQVPCPVVEAISDHLYHHNSNTHWGYATSNETDETIRNGRAALAALLNSSPSEIVFGPNMTTLTFHLSRALGRAYGPGDEIVVTELDHHANIDPWRSLAKERGVAIRSVRVVPETGQLDWKDLESKVNKRTKVLAIGVASNALGTINDIPRAAEIAHNAGALLFADAVHSTPHIPTDVKAWDCDFLACSAYKFYGPHMGVLYGRQDLLQSIDFPKLLPAPDTAPERAETGTQNHEGIAGSAAAVDFLASLSAGASRRDKVQGALAGLDERGHALITQLWNGLSNIPGVRLFGPTPTERRTPTLAFIVQGIAPSEVSAHLATRGVFVSHGNFYAATVVERLGFAGKGVVRAGCACYTTSDEVDRLIEGVREIARHSAGKQG
ncbi:MAG: cysteine desulfurase-like protein [Acidobacteria bacterium]|nr:MAG: cysteine desulfurase-like protein [Acidobacteriota bacterium]